MYVEQISAVFSLRKSLMIYIYVSSISEYARDRKYGMCDHYDK